MDFLILLAQAEAAPPGSCLQAALLPMVLIVGMYFMMIRPQQKQVKETQRFQDSLKVGDEVITAGGLYATIKEVQSTAVQVEIARNVKVRIVKTQIVQRQQAVEPEVVEDDVADKDTDKDN